MDTREFDYKGKKLFYRVKGTGPLLVLLHGFGEDGSIWKAQYELFPHHTLLVPDLPGSGQSEAIDDMSMEGLAEAGVGRHRVERLPEVAHPAPPGGREAHSQPLPVGNAADDSTTSQSEVSAADYSLTRGAGGGPGDGLILIGHSMGGYITLAFAEKYPGMLRAFGLFHSSAFADSEEKKETRAKGIRFMEENGANAFLQTATPNLYAPQSKNEHPEWVTEHLASVHNFSAANLVSYYKAMMQRPDRTAVLKESRVPVLFVLGQHDTAVPLHDGLKQCYLPQLAYIHILAAAGHMGMIEQKEKTATLLTQFVNTIECTA